MTATAWRRTEDPVTRPNLATFTPQTEGTTRQAATPAARGWLSHVVPLVAAAVVYVVSLQQVDLDRVDGLGLFSALPPTYWIAGALLMVGFGMNLASPRPSVVWGTVYMAALIVFLHGTPGFVSEHPRFPTAWTHVGFVDQIIENGTVDANYDARYNWPGAFSLGAFLTELTGSTSSLALLRWAPVVMNLLFLGAMRLITQQVSRDRRIQLAGLCVSILAAWVGQDYLAPQAVAFLVYLTLIGVLLRCFRDLGDDQLGWFSLTERLNERFPRVLGQQRLAEHAGEPGHLAAWQALALYVMILVMVGVLAFSHQLTPFVAAAATLVLVLVGRITRPLLPLTIVVGAVAWVAFGATTFLRSNLAPMLESIGDLRGSIDENVQGRVGGSHARELVLNYRMGLTAFVALLAVIGIVNQWRAKRADWVLLALAAIPVPLLALNSYGGEVLLRVMLFTLPFLAVLAPFAFFREDPEHGVRARVAVFVAMCIAALPVFVIARFGNESFERIYTSDIVAWNHVTDLADSDTRVVVLNFSGPWRFSHLLDTDYRVFPDEHPGDPTVDSVDEMVREGGSGSMLLLGEGGARYFEDFLGESPTHQDDLADALLQLPGYSEVFRHGASRILVWVEPDGGQGAT